jgi:hypothetical protein
MTLINISGGAQRRDRTCVTSSWSSKTFDHILFIHRVTKFTWRVIFYYSIYRYYLDEFDTRITFLLRHFIKERNVCRKAAFRHYMAFENGSIRRSDYHQIIN